MRLKILILLLLILIKSSYEGQAANTTVPISDTIPSRDTICPLVDEYKVVYRDAVKFRLTDSLLKITEAQLSEVKYQKSLVEEREAETIANYDRQIFNLEKQIELYKEQVKAFEKMIRRAKRKQFVTGAVGLLSTAAMIYIATK